MASRCMVVMIMLVLYQAKPVCIHRRRGQRLDDATANEQASLTETQTFHCHCQLLISFHCVLDSSVATKLFHQNLLIKCTERHVLLRSALSCSKA